MKLTQLAAAVGLVAGLLGAGSASATNVCANCVYNAGGATYLGTLNPLVGDIADFTRPDLAVAVATHVTDYWLFDISPAGDFQLLSSFIPAFGTTARITNFTIGLHSASGTCPTVAAPVGAGGLCTGVTIGSLLATATSQIGGAFMTPVTLVSAGRYAFQIDYDLAVANGQTSSYNGQVSVTQTVPEPASLGLVGIALLGAAAGLRRARKA